MQVRWGLAAARRVSKIDMSVRSPEARPEWPVWHAGRAVSNADFRKSGVAVIGVLERAVTKPLSRHR